MKPREQIEEYEAKKKEEGRDRKKDLLIVRSPGNET
jgi:hypothetical protein